MEDVKDSPQAGPSTWAGQDSIAASDDARTQTTTQVTEGGGPLDPAEPDAQGSFGARFRVIRQLGEGGMGIVYEAWDHEREERVALKTMRRFDPSALFRFKREFRALADITHPNLVALHELVSADDRWFFTMELIQGVDLLRHVQLDEGAQRVRHTSVDAARLRAAVRQLVEGVGALHRAGKLHRDIKPSNVLVTAEGRVVVLDFGLVTEADPHALMADDAVVGTAAYMAPEQASAGTISEASDWYSVGALIYEALTRQVPFQGELRLALAATAVPGTSSAPAPGARTPDDTLSAASANAQGPPAPALTGRANPLMLMLAKQSQDPIPPSRLVAGVPPDLEQLCMDLLQRDPATRPTGEEILRRLAGGHDGAIETVTASTLQPSELLLVGRARHLQQLADGLAACRPGHPVTLYVHGESGMGKSALIHHFLDSLQSRGEALVLPGRCYERESVPYKALDSVIDALSQHLRRLSEVQTAALLPRDIPSLARLFPVLRRVEPIAALADDAADEQDPHQTRLRAVRALRALLKALAAGAQVVFYIDDMQWGDADSARLLVELLAAPDPPPLVLLGSYRSDEAEGSPLLRELQAAGGGARSTGEVREVVVGPLSPDDSLALARALLDPRGEDVDARAAVIARESDGNPFFITELVRHAQSGAEAVVPQRAEVSLEQVLLARVARLPGPERQLLETVAVAGRPIAQAVAFRAGQIAASGRSALSSLRAVHLVRSRGARNEDKVEVYHDRIREILVDAMPPARLADVHRALAVTLEDGVAEPDMLAIHFRGAGEREKAGTYAQAAAERAFATLAFARAAEMYRLALELRAPAGPERRALLRRLAEALANAGRSVDAAGVYLDAAAGAPALEALELRRAAAEKFLVGGHVDEGQDLLRSVLAAVDMTLPNTPFRSLLSLVYHRLRIRLRGLRFDERPAAAIPAEQLTRIDTCWAAALGLAMVDNVRGADFQARNLLLSLEAGEPYRVARALAMEVGYVASAGHLARARAERLRTEALAIATRVGHPHALGVATMTAGLTYYFLGGWKQGYDLFERSEEILRRQCTGVRGEIVNGLLYSLRCLVYLGRLKDAAARLPGLIDEALDRSDLYASTYFRLRYAYLLDLAEDAPERALARVRAALSGWSHRGYHIQHYLELFAEGEIELYAAHGAAAREHIVARLQQVQRSHIFRVQHLRIEAEHLHGRAALAAAAAAAEPGPRRRLLQEAEADARLLAREGVPWALAMAKQLAGGVACLKEHITLARNSYLRAAELFADADMLLYAAACRRRLGELLPDEEGRALVTTADAFMREQGIQNPGRWTTMYCGFDAKPPPAAG